MGYPVRAEEKRRVRCVVESPEEATRRHHSNPEIIIHCSELV
jgi:hypothetical protein